MIQSYLQWVISHPRRVVFFTLLIVGLLASGVLKLSFTSDFRTYFGPENPQLKAFEAMERTYSNQDNIYFLVQNPNGSLFTPQGLTLIEQLTERGWQLPYSQRVDSLQNYQHTQVDGDDLLINDFYRTEELTEDLSGLQQLAISLPELLHKLISADGGTSGVNVRFLLPEGKSAEKSPEVVYAARALADEFRARYPDFRIMLSGSLVSNVTMGEAIHQDIQSLLLVSYLVMISIMLLTLRTLSGTLLILGIISFSVVSTMGLFGWLGYTLTPPTGFVPTAIMTIAVADTVHILVSYYFALRHGQPRQQALLNSMRLNFSPVLITSITTMVGVLCLNTSDSPPYRDMGNMIAAGVFFAWAFTLTFLPAMLALLPVPEKLRAENNHQWIDRLADLIVRHHKGLLLSMLLIVAACASQISRNEITERWHEFFDESFEVRQTNDMIDRELGGLHLLFMIADSQQAEGINNVEYLQQLEAFSQWLRAQPEVVHVSSLTDIIKRLNQNLNGGDPAFYRVPDSAEAAAQYLLLYELSLPLGLGLDDTVNNDRSSSRLQVRLYRSDSVNIIRVEQAAIAWAQQHAPLLHLSEATGLDVVFANLTFRNIHGMLQGTGIALVLISLLLIAALRSWKMGLISMIPNILPAAMAYGLWGMISGLVDTATSVVVCLSLGIVVDDTVHFLSKYQHARKVLTMQAADAIRYAFHTVGVALLITSAILVGGFAVLEFSHFNPSTNMGNLLALSIAVALLIDFLLLPPLLLLLDRGDAGRNRSGRGGVSTMAEQTTPGDTIKHELDRQST